QEIAALSGTCDQLREQLARAGEQLLMLQCKQAEEKQTAEEDIMKAAEKRRQLLSQLIAEKNTTANAVKMAFAEVEHLIEKGSAEDRSHSEQYLSGTQPQQKDAAAVLPKAGYKTCKLSSPSQPKICQIKSC
uniref:Uncharacterized protein n=1 Tax=Plectus sambesii TaxID=2011161 RepID=A0A914VRM9_9BILA